jgi:TonB-dependent SusC/RagA subfamily outer membrane receptor
VPQAQQQQGRVLVVLDGKMLAPDAKLDLSKVDVNTVNVLQPADALKKFGQRGRWGAVVVTTRPRMTDVERAVAAAASVDLERVAEAVAKLQKVELPELAVADVERLSEEVARLQKVVPADLVVAPRGAIRGHVIIGETGLPAANVEVMVDKQVTTTDTQGRYVVRDVTVGQRMVDVRMPGYIGRMPVEVVADVPTTVPTLSLNAMTETERIKFERAVKLDDVVVTAINAKDRVRMRAIQGEPVQIRPQPLIIIDGVVVADPNEKGVVAIDGKLIGAGNDILARLDPAAIESIEVIKGPAAVSLYGERAVNGVISITMPKR